MHLLSSGSQLLLHAAQAICRMLVHSLWIGIILAVLTGVIVIATKRKSAALRYNLLTASLLLFIAVMISLLFVSPGSSTGTGTQQVTATNAIRHDLIQPTAVIKAYSPGPAETVNLFLNKYAGIIVLLWFCVIAFRTARLIYGIRAVYELRNKGLSDAGQYWNEKLQQLALSMNMKKKVRIFQSAVAKIPMAAGHFKPVILFPLGLITSLPADEVEAVLLHELAHIRRRDYLVNMLQHLVEILFFFNPAVWWLSSLIKAERENCCDDIAVAHTGNKRHYINALVSFQQYHLDTPQYATALAGRKDHLLQRIKRMLNNNNKTLSSMEKTILVLCLIITTSLAFIFSKATSDSHAKTLSAVTDTARLMNRYFDPNNFKEGTSASYTETIDGVSHTMRLFKRAGILYQVYGDITAFKVNGQLIPQEMWAKYGSLIDELNAGAKPPREENSMLPPEEAASIDEAKQLARLSKQAALAAIDSANAEKQKAALNKLQTAAEADRADAEKKKAALNKLAADAERNRINAGKKNPAPYYYDYAGPYAAGLPAYPGPYTTQYPVSDNKTVSTTVSTRTDKEVEVKTPVNYYKTGISRSLNGTLSALPALSADVEKLSNKINVLEHDGTVRSDFDLDALTQNLISDLASQKIITNKAQLSYKLTNDYLVVNDKVQDKAVHEKFKAKYIKSPDWKLLYRYKE